MFLNRIKWMAVGAAIVVLGTYLFNSKDIFKKLTGSNKFGVEQNKINPEFAQYISAFTTGYISSGSTIKIKFASELQQVFSSILLYRFVLQDANPDYP